MNKLMMMVSAVLCMGMFVFTACGDDEDKNSSDKDPFESLDCTDTEATSCDYMICAGKPAYDAVVSADCSTQQDYCDAVAGCYTTYVDCMVDVCPAGTTYDANNATAMSTCSTNVGTCVTDAQQPVDTNDGNDTNNGTGGNEDPFGNLNCGDTDNTASCDYYACAYKAAYDTVVGTVYADCYATYVECFNAECPAGGTYADADINVLTTCATNLSNCVNATAK